MSSVSVIGNTRNRNRRDVVAPRVSVVVPAMNEARNLEVLLPRLVEAMELHEVVLVDGGSVDDTVETARRVLPDVRVVQQVRTGKGNAVAAGLAAARGDIVVLLDADLSADPREIPRFVAALVSGADVAKGSRFALGGSSSDITRLRSAGNRVLSFIFNVLFRRRFTDLCYGFNAFWSDLVPMLDLPDHRIIAPTAGEMLWGDGFEIEALLACRFAAAGAVVTEVASVERRRGHGASNLRAVPDGLRVLRTLLSEWRRSLRVERAAPRPGAHAVRATAASRVAA